MIALGGSIIVSRSIQTRFLGRFRKFLLPFLEEGKRFVLVAGGGRVARDYQRAASQIVELSDEDKDWLGIHATRINGHLLRAIFFDLAHPVVFDDPFKVIANSEKYNLFIAAGWKPGWSTDYDAVLLAHRFGAKRLIVATKISYVYDADIEKNPKAKPLPELSWKQYRSMVGDTWIPGMRSPVDPIAAKFAQDHGIEAVVVRGTDLKNLAKVLRGEEFRGSIIR